MNRNANDTFNKTPVPHFPRSRHDMKVTRRLQTQEHGRLYPFFARAVYPGDTWQMDMTTFVRTDTSFRVPLDDIFQDIYWFFIPYRIIDKDFPKILGEGEPSDYDDVDYGFPTLETGEPGGDKLFSKNNLLPYLGYNQNGASLDDDTGLFEFNFNDTICPYPLMAYYKVYNDWFRDENLDASIPYEDLKNADMYGADSIFQAFNCLKVNRYHDYFSSAQIAPQKGPAQTIPLGTTAPVGFSSPVDGTWVSTVSSANSISKTGTSGSSLSSGDFIPILGQVSKTGNLSSNPAFADLSEAAGTINELRLAFAIQALYERRGRFGTRYIETLRGQWGIEVPDSFLERPEYLGGSRTTLNNIPVLDNANADLLGQMAGNSATLSNDGSWSKTFVEYGIILGLSCTRIKHSYTQGIRKEIFDLKSQLDLYNPVFANIGLQPIKLNEIWNASNAADQVFAYRQAYDYLRTDYDTFAGLFGIFSDNDEIKNYWHYGDYYQNRPYFSADWLKEPTSNVARTLTGRLITDANESTGHQFMFAYYYHPVVTRILPAYSVPVELIGHL